jgi:CRP-like cAMP-binding protein
MSEPRQADLVALELEALASASFLEGVPREALEAVAARGTLETYAAGEVVFGELEPRETLGVIVTGRVRISIGAGGGTEHVLSEAGPGTPLGEVGLLTGRVSSASVSALERTVILDLPREAVADLMTRFPVTARSFGALLARRIHETDKALASVLRDEPVSAEPALLRAQVATRHGILRTLVAAFRETLLQHRTELPFFFLNGFVVSLVLARIVVRLGHFSPDAIRDAYVFGLLLLIATGAAAHFVFDRTARRVLCTTYGAALGFLANELSVLLSFDVFYLDTTTKDPVASDNYRELYDRAPTRWAVILVVAIALQATFMRAFYRRAFHIVANRLRRRLAG